jgi:hypothetical protein
MVSIKHGIGMSAGRQHPEKNMKKDYGQRILKAWIDKEALNFYQSMKAIYGV